MKTVLLFTAACAIFCTTYAAPSMYNRVEAQRENDLAKKQYFHFHIYKDDTSDKEKAKEQFFHFHIYNRKDATEQEEEAERALLESLLE